MFNLRRLLLSALLVGFTATTLANKQSPAAEPTPGAETATEQQHVKPLFEVGLDFTFDAPSKTFDAVKSLLLKHYYTGQLTEDALYWAAIEGMLRHVSPPQNPRQARLWTEPQYDRVINALRGQRHSLGLKTRFSSTDGSLTITTVSPGSPADGKLRAHDRVMRIDGKPLSGLSSAQVKKLLTRSAPPLQLTVVRDIEVHNVTLQPAIHAVAALHAEIIPDQIGYLRLRKVTKNVSKRVDEQMRSWQQSDVNQLIIDLRNNGGGIFLEGLRIAELFIAKGQAILQTVREGKPGQRYVSSNTSPFRLPITVLMNRRTASAAEALITALVTNGKARIIGQKSFGKATMDKTFRLQNNMRVRFIVGAMYTATGHSWHARGLAPNVDVAGTPEEFEKWSRLPMDKRLQTDRQLRAAWQLMREK